MSLHEDTAVDQRPTRDSQGFGNSPRAINMRVMEARAKHEDAVNGLMGKKTDVLGLRSLFYHCTVDRIS